MNMSADSCMEPRKNLVRTFVVGAAVGFSHLSFTNDSIHFALKRPLMLKHTQSIKRGIMAKANQLLLGFSIFCKNLGQQGPSLQKAWTLNSLQ